MSLSARSSCCPAGSRVEGAIIEDDLIARSQAYLDQLFGPGAGLRHTAFLDHLSSGTLRDTLHGYHLMEADTRYLSVEENYLIGMCVLSATGSHATAAMFAKTLLQLGVAPEKILTAVDRLSMWIGGVRAAEVAARVQTAIAHYERSGVQSLQEWFPPPGEAPDDHA